MPVTTYEPKKEPATFEKVWEMFQETDRKIDRLIERDNLRQEAAERRGEEADRRQEAADRRQEAADRRREAADRRREEADRTMEELKQTVRNVSTQIGGMANSDGDAAEAIFATSLESKMMFAGQHYDAIDVNLQRKIKGLRDEFDIVLSNGVSVAIIEVKHKARCEDVEKLVAKKLPDFRTLFPLYKDHTVYLGIGSLSYDARVLAKAHELGVGILRQKGDTIEDDTRHIRAY
jgi:hypothetical protein